VQGPLAWTFKLHLILDRSEPKAKNLGYGSSQKLVREEAGRRASVCSVHHLLAQRLVLPLALNVQKECPNLRIDLNLEFYKTKGARHVHPPLA
jgi:hypothetical protein